MTGLSRRLNALIQSLPLEPGQRVLEIGGGPGAASRAVCELIGSEGHVLMIDRSSTAIAQAERGSRSLIAAGRLSLRCEAAEDFVLRPDEAPFDLAFAFRVGALDGRHPAVEAAALSRIAAALTPAGRLFIDGGDPLREIPLQRS